MLVNKISGFRAKFIFVVIYLFCFAVSCDKYNLERTNPNDIKSKNFVVSVPKLTTVNTYDITRKTALTGGNISSDGGAAILFYGVCWSINQGPTISDTKTEEVIGSEVFGSSLTGLVPGTKYYVRAYATNSVGTGYGNEISFTTPPPLKPVLTTSAITSITLTTASLGGNISSDEGAPVTERGICWNTISDPLVSDNKTIEGAGTGSFSSNITGLSINTKYFARAYATNSEGTSYGAQVTFSTLLPDIDGNTYHTVTIGNQVWIVENLKTTKFNDGTSIPVVLDNLVWNSLTSPGYCWYDNNIANKPDYGALYNWYTIDPLSNGNKNVCPVGWHVPTDQEWTTLTDFTGGEAIVGTFLKESGLSHWLFSFDQSTNSSGFTALPGGLRWSEGFAGLGTKGDWWSSTQVPATSGSWIREMYTNSAVQRGYYAKYSGLSIRCISD